MGRGAYPVSEAAKLVGIGAPKLRSWLFGRGGDAVLTAELDAVENQDALTFTNLVEAYFLAELRRQGVSLQAIRMMLSRAKILMATEHPFATQRFHTDGKAIWLETASEAKDPRLTDLTDGNGAMLEVLENAFRRSVTFREGQAAIWRPVRDLQRIVLDPERRFGRPIDNETGVPTAALAGAVRAEGSIDRAAKVWDVPIEAVQEAAEFEMHHHRRMAA